MKKIRHTDSTAVAGQSDLKATTSRGGNNGVATAPASTSIVVRSEEDKKRILRDRAKALAQKPDTEEDHFVESMAVIEFMLAHERYAMEVAYVREVYPLRDLTPVPCTPSFIVGIINVRGQVVSVMDVKEFFDLPGTGISDEMMVVIVRNPDMECGILVDTVFGERKIPLTEIQSDTSSLRGVRQDYLKGVTKERTIVMDINKLLSDDAIFVHQEVGD